MKEVLRALAVLAEPPGEDTGRIAGLLDLPATPRGWQYNELFLEQLYPYASVYLGAEGMLGGEARDRVAGFWRALGETPPAEPDHLAVLLGLLARLIELERDAGTARADAWHRTRAGLLHEHLRPWLDAWLLRLEEIAPPPYRAWGRLLGRTLEEAAGSTPVPPQPPAAFRSPPVLEEPGEVGGEEFLKQLLVPLRTGMILTRSDLTRAARELDIGARVGERSWVLRAFLQQDPEGALEWLAAEASRQAESLERASGPHVDFWAARARRSAELIGAASGTLAAPGSR